MGHAKEGPPPLAAEVSASWFLHVRRAMRRTTGRELGFAHATRLLAKMLPGWQELPLVGPDGLPLYVDLRAREGYFAEGYSNTVEHMEAVFACIDDGSTVIDVGANVGVWSRHVLSRKKLGTLIAFEPQGRNYELLARNLAVYPMADAVPLAVGRTSGSVDFSTDRDSGQTHLVPGSATSVLHTRRVNMTSLDDWARHARLQRLDLLKVDVEGFEIDVFEGAVEVLKRFRPVLYFEHVPPPGRSAWETPCSSLLASLGYSVRAILATGMVAERSSESARDAIYSHDMLAFPTQ